MLAVEECRLRGPKLAVLPRLDSVGTTYHLSNWTARLQEQTNRMCSFHHGNWRSEVTELRPLASGQPV